MAVGAFMAGEGASTVVAASTVAAEGFAVVDPLCHPRPVRAGDMLGECGVARLRLGLDRIGQTQAQAETVIARMPAHQKETGAGQVLRQRRGPQRTANGTRLAAGLAM